MKQSGFTLIEIMVVVVIIGLLATIGVATYINHLEKARLKITRATLVELGNQAQLFELDQGRPPRNLEELATKEFITEIPLDAWDQELVYDARRGKNPPFRLLSIGADGESGTEDDVIYPFKRRTAKKK